MPANDTRDFHIDSLLTNLLVGFTPDGLIAPGIFPVVNVTKQTGIYAKVDKDAWYRQPSTLRAPGTAPREVNYTVSSATYNAPNYELGTTVAWEVIDNADVPHQPMGLSAQLVKTNLLLDFEIRVRNKVVASVGSATTLSGTSAWSDFANSDPITDGEVAQEAIRSTTGMYANTMIMPQKTYLKMRRHPDIVRFLYPGAGVGGTATADQLASVFGVDRILVPKAIQNTAAEGATATFTDVWSTSCVLAYVAPAPGLMVPSYGYSFRWSGPNIGAGSPGNFAVQRRSDSKRKAEELQLGFYQDEGIVAAELGFRIDTGITS